MFTSMLPLPFESLQSWNMNRPSTVDDTSTSLDADRSTRPMNAGDNSDQKLPDFRTRVRAPIITPSGTVMRVALEEEPSSSDDLQLFTLGGRKHKNLKDLGAAFAVVSVFIASLSVGLLSYTRDIFANRPEGTLPPSSDSAITSLLFITVIFSCVAAMEFTALQLSRTGGLKPAEGHANNSPQEISAKDIGLMRGAAAASPATPTTVIFVGIDVDVEKGDNHLALKSLNKKEKRRREALKMADNMAVTSVCLLFISCLTLFAGIFTFVWANQTRSVAISVTVVFGLWCISPLRYVTIFLASLI